MNPYSYAGGNPTSWTDPDGLSPAYIYGLERQNASLQGQVEFLSAVAVWQAAHIRNLEASLAYVKRVAKWQAGRIRQLENQVEFLEGVARWQSAVINNQRQTIWNEAVQINQLNATINTLQHTIHQLTRSRPSSGHAGGSGGHGAKGKPGGKGGGGGAPVMHFFSGIQSGCDNAVSDAVIEYGSIANATVEQEVGTQGVTDLLDDFVSGLGRAIGRGLAIVGVGATLWHMHCASEPSSRPSYGNSPLDPCYMSPEGVPHYPQPSC